VTKSWGPIRPGGGCGVLGAQSKRWTKVKGSGLKKTKSDQKERDSKGLEGRYFFTKGVTLNDCFLKTKKPGGKKEKPVKDSTFE